jgi:hypothetical protein
MKDMCVCASARASPTDVIMPDPRKAHGATSWACIFHVGFARRHFRSSKQRPSSACWSEQLCQPPLPLQLETWPCKHRCASNAPFNCELDFCYRARFRTCECYDHTVFDRIVAIGSVPATAVLRALYLIFVIAIGSVAVARSIVLLY